MKKLVLSLLGTALIALSGMAVSATVIDGDDLSQGSTTVGSAISYDASQFSRDGKTASASEDWKVTIPAHIPADGTAASVTVTGSFGSSKVLSVTAPDTVRLYLDGDTDNDYVTLNVYFNDIVLQGDYMSESVSRVEPISVTDMRDIRFGVWEGTILFTITMQKTFDAGAADVYQPFDWGIADVYRTTI